MFGRTCMAAGSGAAAALAMFIAGGWLTAQEADNAPDNAPPPPREKGDRPPPREKGERPPPREKAERHPMGEPGRPAGPVTKVVHVEKLPGKDVLDKLNKDVKVAVDEDLKVVVLRGPADAVREAEGALTGRGPAGRGIELVRL